MDSSLESNDITSCDSNTIEPANPDDIIEHLREILSNLNYSTHKCICCEWIDHEDEDWCRCHDCEEYICHECYEQLSTGGKGVFCDGCRQ